MRPSTTYLMRAAGENLVAESLEELAELLELALEHGDHPGTFRAAAGDGGAPRQLNPAEFGRLLTLTRDRVTAAGGRPELVDQLEGS